MPDDAKPLTKEEREGITAASRLYNETPSRYQEGRYQEDRADA